jgi:ATP-dependent helicase/DNAse subunit B
LLSGGVRGINVLLDQSFTGLTQIGQLSTTCGVGKDLPTPLPPSLSPSLKQRFQPLAQLAAAYQQRLRAKKLIDPTEIFWFASQLTPQGQSLLVYGYDFPHIDELQFVNAVAGDRSVLFLPVVDHPLFAQNQRSLQWLQQQGWQIAQESISETAETSIKTLGQQLCQKFLGGQRKETDPLLGTQTQVYAYPHLEAEVRGSLGQVKELLLQGVAANQIAIVARDETIYGPTILDIAHEYDLPIRALYSIPLINTRLGAWLETLGQTVTADLPFETTARLLTHPLCSGLPPGIWLTARKTHPSGLAKWQEILHQQELSDPPQPPLLRGECVSLDAIDLSLLSWPQDPPQPPLKRGECVSPDAIDLSLLSWPQEDRRDNWVERLQNILKTFNLRKRAARWAREAVAYYTFQDALVNLSKPESEILSLEAFIQEISELMALLTVPAAPGRGGVELHTPASLVGTRYDYLFILGMAEGILPAPVADNPVLDFRSRQLLRESGIPLGNAVETAQREALSFYALLKTATQNLTLSYPRLIDRTQMLPSPYINKLGLTVESAPPLSVASVELSRQVYLRKPENSRVKDLAKSSAADAVLANAYHSWTVETRRESSQPPDEYDGAIAIGLDPDRWVFSASQLTNLGQCAFKWFTQKVLRLLDIEEAEEQLSTSLRGRLYHKTLELSVQWAKQQITETDSTFPDIQSAVTEYLETAFLEAEKAENLDKLPPFPGWEVSRQEHLSILNRAIWATHFLKEETEILTTEKKFQGNWYGLKVKGTVDRVDRTPEGLAIVDYKTSSTTPKGAKDANSKAKLDIQLPLYMQVAAPNLFAGEPVANAYYYSLTKGKAIGQVKIDETTLAEFAENVKRHLQEGHYPVNPDVDRAACQYCDYDLVCRQGTRLSRK